MDNYKVLHCDRNSNRGVIACYVRDDLSYNILSVFPREIEIFFFEILLPSTTVGTSYHPSPKSK